MKEFINTDDKIQQFNVLAVRSDIPFIASKDNLQPTDTLKNEEVKNMAQEFKKNNLVRTRRKNI